MYLKQFRHVPSHSSAGVLNIGIKLSGEYLNGKWCQHSRGPRNRMHAFGIQASWAMFGIICDLECITILPKLCRNRC